MNCPIEFSMAIQVDSRHITLKKSHAYVIYVAIDQCIHYVQRSSNATNMNFVLK
jgi:hypothetical protein